MPKQEAPLSQLERYLPPGTYPAVATYLEEHKVHLTVAKERKSILGDYRHRTPYRNHRISVNGNLNAYAFLITLIHELAHLLVFEHFNNKVSAHGKEWKQIYSQLLDRFLKNRVFPGEIENEIFLSLKNPAASSCAEDGLLRALRKYDQQGTRFQLLEEIPKDALFRISDGRVFQRGDKLRKRYRCAEVGSKKVYLFSPVYEVEKV